MGKPLCESCMAWHADGGGPFEPAAQPRAAILAILMCRWFRLFDQTTIPFTIASFLIEWHEP